MRINLVSRFINFQVRGSEHLFHGTVSVHYGDQDYVIEIIEIAELVRVAWHASSPLITGI